MQAEPAEIHAKNTLSPVEQQDSVSMRCMMTTENRADYFSKIIRSIRRKGSAAPHSN